MPHTPLSLIVATTASLAETLLYKPRPHVCLSWAASAQTSMPAVTMSGATLGSIAVNVTILRSPAKQAAI